jgi:DNA-binding SARP family transcriptional activator
MSDGKVIHLLGQLILPSQFSKNNILLLIALNHPKPTRRSEILNLIFPEIEPKEANNRARVTLSRLRKAHIITESEHHISLSPEFKTDLQILFENIQAATSEPDPLEEIKALNPLISSLAHPLIPQSKEPWVQAHQDRWAITATTYLSQLVNLANQQSDFKTVARSAEAIIAHFPFDDDAWIAFLTANAKLGQVTEVLRAFQQARRTLKSQHEDFSPETLEAADSLNLVTAQTSPYNSSQEKIIVSLFHRLSQESPELAHQLLSSPSFRTELIAHPAECLPLLRQALAQNPAPGPIRERIEVRIITALALLEDNQAIISLAEEFLSRQSDPARQRIALLHLSFSYFQTGRIDQAFASIDKAAEIAELHHTDQDVWECRAQKATFYLLNNQPQEAIPILTQAVEALNDNPRDRLTLQANLAQSFVIAGKYENAARILHQLDSQTVLRQYPLLESVVAHVQLALAMEQSDLVAARTQGVRALKTAYRSSARSTLFASAKVCQLLHQHQRTSVQSFCHQIQSHLDVHGLVLPKITQLPSIPPSSTTIETVTLRELIRALIAALRSLS